MTHPHATIISVLELRQKFGVVRKGLAEGKSYIVIYRGEPVAELTPATQDTLDMFFTAPKPVLPGASTRNRTEIAQVEQAQSIH